jgi:hypothetical protein
LAAALVAAIVAVLVGCGGSSKPSYCSDLSNLKSSVNDLKNVSITDLSAVKSAIQKVESDGKAVVSSAKNDFPSETSALSTSLSALETTLGQLNSSTATAALKQLPAQVSATVTAVDNFSSATKSKCD